ncbi:MAG: PTS sugar transporter subunit IIB [Bacillota bacterium]
MENKQIMLVCAAGMSTSLLVGKMQTFSKETARHHNIFALSSSEADSYIKASSVDVILLGPQVRFMLDDFKKKVAGLNIPVDVIPMSDYGMMHGENVLLLAEKLMK